jgi:putative ABC transport system ATP-binding protein
MNSEAPIIRVRGLRKIYRTGAVSVEALRGVDLDVPPGEFLSIVGPSGSGKSTLFHIIGGLTPPSAGEVIVAGRNVSAVGDAGRTELRRRDVSFVFQKFNLLPNLSARDNIRTALYISGLPSDRFDAAFETILDLLGIAGRLNHKPSEMSGGEQQRVAIARAMACEPPLLLGDEPTGNLDTAMARDMLELLERLNAAGTTVVYVTHDQELAAMASRIVSVRDGLIVGDTGGRS